MIFNLSKKALLLVSVLALVVLAAITLGLVFGLQSDGRQFVPEVPLSGAAVASNGPECAAIGAEILRKNGSAVDAAIATMVCEEVACPQSTGIGGGFLATIYDRATRTVISLDAREMAPQAATEEMFVDNGQAAVEGGLAVATPGVIRGFWEMHQRYGSLEWKELFEPTIELCRKGVVVSDFMASAMQSERDRLRSIPSLREVFVNPATDDVWQKGDLLKRDVFAETLEIIANEKVDSLHGKTGSLLPKLMADLREFGSIITEEDFYNYKPRWLPAASTTIRQNYSVYSMPLPGSGTIGIYILNLLDGYDDLDPEDPLTWHRVVESFKHAYGVRTRVGDPDFVSGIEFLIRNLTSKPYADDVRTKIDDNRTFTDYEYYGAEFAEQEDHGTAHVSVLASNGDAVAITGTINTFFGCKRRSPSTGIILNNIMDDFSTPGVINSFDVPASPANFVAPGKRPLSSMTPTIVVDSQGDVRMVVGSSGGTRITTSTMLMVLRGIFFGQDLNTMMLAPRLHHQLAPLRIDLEKSFGSTVVDALLERGHVVREVSGIASIVAIVRERNNSISAAYDPNRGGSFEIIP
ncbi:scoloptoxin SSD14-like [Malaya genurostris]|uniref:scoloptoxin SSD14-like n=1 Tax=Malaya genurostris TaxID=325434 RepID=UPI0026F3D527|nr:scoloptoxin SSD14-like [Malaya genurostris]